MSRIFESCIESLPQGCLNCVLNDECAEKQLYDKGRTDAIDECIKKLKLEFHPCLNCISYSTDECNNKDYFQDCCATEKTISFEDIINFVKQLKENNI